MLVRPLAAKGLNVGADFRLSGVKELFGREAGEGAAGVEQHDAVSEIESFVEVVRYE